MPTTTIETPLTDARFERRVAKELSFWWRRQGTDIRHVLTRFITLSGDRVYSGPLPMAIGGGDPTPPPAFALVSCLVSHRRDESFKRDYARHVRAVLGPEVPADRVFVSFRATDPADHFTPGSSAWNDPKDVPS
jgi:hypothetical protein